MASKGVKKRAKARRSRRGTHPLLFDIKIGTVDDSLITFANIIQAYHAGKMKREKMTALVYALNSYCNFLRLKNEQDFEKRLDEIEARINENQIGFRNEA